MQLLDGRLLPSPSDLTAYLACPHLTRLQLAVARGKLTKPHRDNPQAELVRRKGDEHEAAYLASLRAAGHHIVEIPFEHDWEASARATEEAIRAGAADVIYQACLAEGDWRGFADFLERLPDGTYEAVDTKLARHAKPAAVLQLCFYTDQLGRVQGRQPELMHVVLGTGVRESFRFADFAAYYRRVRDRFLAHVGNGGPTYPYPVEHCSLCDFLELCQARWAEDDHLVRVANIRRDQIERLGRADITTLAGLTAAAPGTRIPRLAATTFETLRDQAALQHAGGLRYHLLAPEEKRGFALLPEPSDGDLFFDMEGDPFWEPGRGLEYLFGVLWEEHGEPVFRAFWAEDRASERAAFEAFVDLVHERLERDPELHVYHYAAYEPSTLKRLMGEYGTREDELDDLLRRELFVDLYAVVRQSLRASLASYSIKEVERFFFTREAELRSGDDSILLYEEFLRTRDPELLRKIEAYNEEDCRSTLALRDWLLERRVEAEAEHGVAIAWREPPELREPSEESVAAITEKEALRAALLARGEQRAAQLLDYHRREAKPVWWWFFERLKLTPGELVDDPDSIGDLAWDGAEPERVKRSLAYTFTFPVQEHKLGVGDTVADPLTGEDAGWIHALDSEAGRLVLVRGRKLAEVPLPRALIPGGPYDTRYQQRALRRLARSLVDGDGRYPALESVLRRELPLGGARVQRETLDEMRQLVLDVDGSHLFVQGPPGSGKTYTGARLVVHLLARGKRVGIASTSHKAIHNLLRAVEEAAGEAGVRFRGLKKCTDDNPESEYEGRFVENETAIEPFLDPEVGLVAGTAWLFAREELDSTLDYLFLDEAGQISLADALAMGTSARTLVLLGDPLQLAQVTQGSHPDGSGASALEHLLGPDRTVPEERGLFLAHSYRMHPDVCRFVSEAFYEGRLDSAAECAGRTTPLGTGLRFLPVEHEGNRQASPEEAEAVQAEVARLLGAGVPAAEILVVAAYNAQVRCLREVLPADVRVGTVDKFQGQEGDVVFFSMASSSAAEIPRGLEFLLSRNRLNVAISRARCLAYLVCSPRLLEVDCKSIEQMRLANALCLLVELAETAVAT